jgi:hypothetical protein
MAQVVITVACPPAALERMTAHELKMPTYHEEELTWD